jgi:hypothetical protein
MALLRDNVTPEDVYQYYVFGYKSKTGEHDDADLIELPNGPEKRFGKKTDNLMDINWYSVEDLEINEHLFGDYQLARLKAALNVQNYQKHNNALYVTNLIASVIAEAPHYEGMCMCGTKGSVERQQLNGKMGQILWCNNWKYCARCAWKRSLKNTFKLSKAYGKAKHMYFITLTMPEFMEFNDIVFDQITAAWDMQMTYVKAMLKKKLITGGIYGEEISLHSLYPKTLVNPHLHVVVSSEEELKSHTVAGMKVDVREIKSQQSWDNHIKYVTKSIKFGQEYVKSWTPENARVINKNFKEFICGHSQVFNHRKQTGMFGLFSLKTNGTIANSVYDYKLEEGLLKPADIKAEKKRLAKLKSKKEKPVKEKAARKNACKIVNKKIEYDNHMYEDFEQGVKDALQLQALPSETTDMLKTAYDMVMDEPEQQPSNFWRNMGLGALAVGGAYAGGKMGFKPLEGFSGAIDNNVVNPVMKNFIRPGFEKASPYIGGAIDKTPFLGAQTKDSLKGHLAPSAQDYSQAIRDSSLTAGLEGLYNQSKGLTDVQRKGTVLQDMDPTAMESAMRTGQLAASPVLLGGLAKSAPGMLGGLASGMANKLPSTAPAMGPVAKGMNWIGTQASKIPGASVVSKGLNKLMGPASAVIGVEDAWDLGQRNVNMMADAIPTTGQLFKQPTSMFSAKTLIGANPFINPAGFASAVNGVIQRQSWLPQWSKDWNNKVVKGIGGTSGVAGHVAAALPTYGIGGLVAPVWNQALQKNENAALMNSANLGSKNRMLELFNQAVTAKDQGYNNPLQGWYSSLPPEHMDELVRSLDDKALAKRITELRPQ